MMNQPAIKLPTQNFTGFDNPELQILPVEFEGQIDLRLDPEDHAARDALHAAILIPLPGPCQFIQNQQRRLDWLGPDFFRLHLPIIECDSCLQTLAQLPSHLQIHAVEVSDYYACQLMIAGPSARDLLATAIPLDLAKASFASGTIKGTRMANATIWLACLDDDDDCPHFTLSVRWSFADYVIDYLGCAAQEFMPNQHIQTASIQSSL
ncbi:MAG: sarcosine oxidase subunit gamma family protein [Pseudomonadota bacterium]